MGNSLEHLLAEGVISEIITRLKSGKEADVYAVRQGGKVIAAKVYKDRAHRSFKNNAAYLEGRQVRNSRSQRAMDRGSKFGKDAAEDAWKAEEANVLYKLHAAGVRVPTPVMFIEGVLFMELVLDAHGHAAPRLIDSELSVDDAHGAYLDMLTQLVRMLCCDLIHGDLSPYNVLWAVTGPTIIDFPQCVSASHNSSSENFFLRDARNILGHFAAIDPRLRSRSSDAFEIWRAYVRRELSPDFLPTGRASRPEPRPQFGGHGSPRPSEHRGPPQQTANGARHHNGPRPQNPAGPRNPLRSPAQGASDSRGSQRNGPPARGAHPSASKPKSYPAPGHSRGGPRRPDVIVLTRRSSKPADAPPNAENPNTSRADASSSESQRTDPNANSRFSPRSDASPRWKPTLNSGPNHGAAATEENSASPRKRRRRRGPRTPGN